VLTVVLSVVAGVFSIVISTIITGLTGVTIGINKKDHFLIYVSLAAIVLAILAIITFFILLSYSNM